MPVRIRTATNDDSTALCRLLPQLSERPDSSQSRVPTDEKAQAILERLLGNEFVHLLVAEHSTQSSEVGTIVGTLILLIVPNLTHGGHPWAQIENVVVDQTMRRQGVGRQLLTAAVELARAQGCYKIQLISGTKPEQLAFYREVGFATEICVGHKQYLEAHLD